MRAVLLTATLFAAAAERGALKSAVEAKSIQTVGASGKVYCDLWMRSTPALEGSSQRRTALCQKYSGTFSSPPPYTLRYSNFPITGDHPGVAPQRDLFTLTKLADDADPGTPVKFDALMAMSRKVAGTVHPLVMSIWKPDTYAAGFAKDRERDGSCRRRWARCPMAIILTGRGEG